MCRFGDVLCVGVGIVCRFGDVLGMYFVRDWEMYCRCGDCV